MKIGFLYNLRKKIDHFSINHDNERYAESIFTYNADSDSCDWQKYFSLARLRIDDAPRFQIHALVLREQQHALLTFHIAYPINYRFTLVHMLKRLRLCLGVRTRNMINTSIRILRPRLHIRQRLGSDGRMRRAVASFDGYERHLFMPAAILRADTSISAKSAQRN